MHVVNVCFPAGEHGSIHNEARYEKYGMKLFGAQKEEAEKLFAAGLKPKSARASFSKSVSEGKGPTNIAKKDICSLDKVKSSSLFSRLNRFFNFFVTISFHSPVAARKNRLAEKTEQW
tara:strand:+ start:151 stop:504 length:354 start_codon:yes stop_codon:yes gene_type:complete